MTWQAEAPSNIALIKYMGKENTALNLPDNPSLSYTLQNFKTRVMLEPSTEDRWESLDPGFSLSAEAQQRFIAHLQRIRNWFDFDGYFLIQSANNFPHSSGLASSASSFAALTMCAVEAICAQKNIPLPDVHVQAQLSRMGSGSSCRSFFSPWALWEQDRTSSVDLPYKELFHQVILISSDVKKVSSSEAHQRIKTSPLFASRRKRAADNLEQLLQALRNRLWSDAYEICWREFDDMHTLFETCAQPFSYRNQASRQVLASLQNFWEKEGNGPLVTMDAGPNIHLLYPASQQDLALRFQKDYLKDKFHVL